ncbi:MAG: thioredoxin domain-containing protein [Chloroflexota bacterium]
MSNRLIHATSPYLLQHAHNPVDWFPWGEEAFAAARAADKPLLVSIGYAACHWCHVMERESFEDQDTAALMNELFVCMKVDREERPDVDQVYMQAHQAMHGHGGWPLNVFLLPDGRPFYGGTYFPPSARGGMPSWAQVLRGVAQVYRERREGAEQSATALTAHLRAAAEAVGTDIPMRADDLAPALDEAYRTLAEAYDPANGGFGGAPKFPPSMTIGFLLRHHQRTGQADALPMALHTLERMAAGGMHDQVGGGFARYSVDERWLVPHFEKMLYDNAQLALAYLEAHLLTGEPWLRAVAESTLDYLLREMRNPEGGFHASQDADSEGHEGLYYLWTREQVSAMLGEQDGALFCRVYGVRSPGSFEGRSILHLPEPLRAVAAREGLSEAALDSRLAPLRERLRVAREGRVHPATDDKAVTAWNAMALRGLAEAGGALGRADYVEAARSCALFILTHLRGEDGRLLRSWRDGRAEVGGFLEDHALTVTGLLALHAATLEHRWLWEAQALGERMSALFWDADAGVCHDTPRDGESLIVRPRDITDNATPSGSSAAAEAYARLAVVTGDETLARRAQRLLAPVAPLLGRHPGAFGNWLMLAERIVSGPRELALVGGADERALEALVLAGLGRFDPHRTTVGQRAGEGHPFPTPLLAGRGASGPAAYVCQGYACALPAHDAATLAAQLEQDGP